MGHLDDLYNQVQGGAPKSSGSGVGAPAAFGVQTVTLKASRKALKEEAQKSQFEHRDLGTKKDPTKLRDQVLAPTEEADPIDALLHSSVEDVKKQVAHDTGSKSKEESHGGASHGKDGELHDRAKFQTGGGFNQKKFTRRLGKYVV